ncbi:caspase family protein [Pantanalinema rosaneae CENA516]|uniref:nSTAND1 domain-containing NTPase n=1 Tax=Pantanalinema rosaneae TaxID=1620701 RepID=UPI003D6EDF11
MARYALVIGISEYNDSLLPNLSKTASDAKAIAALLRESNTFQKVTVLPSTVNQQDFVQALKKFLEEADKNEALIYYTGHGITQVIEDSFGRKTKQGHLVMSDSRVTLNPQNECIAIGSSIPLPEFNQVIQDSNLSNLVVLLDCCHSQYVLERGLLERLTAFSANTDYYFVAACRTTEAARAKKSEQHSVFTGALLAALAAENADEDGVVTGDRVFDSLYRGLRGLGQEPIRMGWGRSIPIVRYPEKRLEPEALFNPTNPYVGLAAFEPSQQDYFFGREQAIRDLLDRLTKARFLAVTGSSGCGKSSLVKAGLLPPLACDRPIATMTPGSEPLETWQKLLQQHQNSKLPLVLLIDQFEELFTLCQDAEKQQAFIQHLVDEVTQPDRRTQVIVTIRSDFLAHCAKFPTVAALINSKEPPQLYLVPELSLAELQAAIVKPALRHGVTFAEGLAADIAAEVVDQRGALPLLQYALTKLWDACISENSLDRLLTREAYEQIGGVNGALRDTANLLYDTSSTTEQPLIRKLMLELVRVNDDQSRTRRRVSRDRLEKVVAPTDQLQPILDKLTRNRLIVLDERAIEVTHEALLTEWTLLDSWIKAEQEQIYLRDQVEACYKDWQERYQRSPDALLSGALLAAVEEKLNWQHLPEAEFVRQSIENRERSVKAQLRKQRQFFLLASAFLMSIVAGTFIYFRQEAISAQDKQAETLVTLAEFQFKNHQQFEAFKNSLKALNILKSQPDINLEKYLKRIQPIIYGTTEINSWQAHPQAIYGLSLNHNLSSFISQKEIAIASSDASGEIKLWNTKGELITPLHQQSGYVRRIAFSHNSKLLASTSTYGEVQLWDLTNNSKRILGNHKGRVYVVAFNEKDTVLASVGKDSVIRLWQVSTKQKQSLPSLNANNFTTNPSKTAIVISLDLHPTQELIAYAGDGDYSVRLWRWNTDNRPTMIGSHNAAINDAKFSSDGSLLATASNDGTIKIWSLKQGNSRVPLVAEIRAHNLAIYTVAFSSTGDFLASSGADKVVKVWNLSKIINEYNLTKKPVKPNEKNVVLLQGHTSDVNQLEFIFSRDPNFSKEDNDRFIISTGDDSTIKVWDWKIPKNLLLIKEISEEENVNTLSEYACSLLYLYANPNQYKDKLECSD